MFDSAINFRTISDILSSISNPNIEELETPKYRTVAKPGKKVMLAVEAMLRHTADAGWQLTTGLRNAGYNLWGYGFNNEEVNVSRILEQIDPSILVLQDKREWEGKTARDKDPKKRFIEVGALKDRDDVFKLTVLKDAHQKPGYHRISAEEIGAHAWITYYHPKIVKHLAPYVRTEHLVRTTHSVDSEVVPGFNPKRKTATVLSGAISWAYPFRARLYRNFNSLPSTTFVKHPGYQAIKRHTPEYLKKLSEYKVSICTTSKYGYSLRKIIESTACGCRVITDLPIDDPLPEIDGNLVRVSPSISIPDLSDLIRSLYPEWDPKVQEQFSIKAKNFYDWRLVGKRLSEKIDELKNTYNQI